LVDIQKFISGGIPLMYQDLLRIEDAIRYSDKHFMLNTNECLENVIILSRKSQSI